MKVCKSRDLCSIHWLKWRLPRLEVAHESHIHVAVWCEGFRLLSFPCWQDLEAVDWANFDDTGIWLNAWARAAQVSAGTSEVGQAYSGEVGLKLAHAALSLDDNRDAGSPSSHNELEIPSASLLTAPQSLSQRAPSMRGGWSGECGAPRTCR